MEKRISYTQFQSIVAVAKACDPIFRQKESIKRKIEKLYQDYNAKDNDIATFEVGIVQTYGLHVDQLVKKVMDAKGTRYLPTDIVTYDKEAKQYVINVPDEDGKDDPVEPKAEETLEDDNELPWTQD